LFASAGVLDVGFSSPASNALSLKPPSASSPSGSSAWLRVAHITFGSSS